MRTSASNSRVEVDYIDDDGIVHLVGEYRVKLADGREMGFQPEGFIWVKFPKPSRWLKLTKVIYFLRTGYWLPDLDPDPDLL